MGPMWIADRIIAPELLDHAGAAGAAHSLDDLVRINRLLGGYRTLRWTMRQVVKPADVFTLLDVGAASGDMAAAIRRWYPKAVVTSFDYRAHHLARAAHPKVVGDAFEMPFAVASFDIVFSSLFLHHFRDEQVIELLKNFGRLARRAVLAIDLDRGALAARFLPATKWLFGWDPITLHDGPISVRAGFKREELLRLAERAGLTRARVRLHRPWSRLSLIASPPET